MAGFAKIEDGRESCRCFDASIQSFQNVFEKIELRSRRQLVNDDDVKLRRERSLFPYFCEEEFLRNGRRIRSF